MDLAERRKCLPLALSALILTGGPLCSANFDLFGLFGSETPPAPSPTTLPYQVEFAIEGDDSVESDLKVSSNFYKRRLDPPPDAESLVRRLEADFAPMLDALWSDGYYNATIRASERGFRLEPTLKKMSFMRRRAIKTAPSCRSLSMSRPARCSHCTGSRSSIS